MRKCLRCEETMIEGLEVKVEGGAYGLKVSETGIFKDNLGKIKCAVCPKCGYLETYIDKPEKVLKIKEKQ